MKVKILLSLIVLIFSLIIGAQSYNIDNLIHQVSKIRELTLKRKIRYQFATKKEILKYIEKKISTHYTPQKLLNEEIILKDLELIPSNFNYLKATYKLLEEQVAGIYAPELKKLYIAKWLDLSTQYIILVHEITHALQDQNFNLGQLLNSSNFTDKQLAISSLVEGDAMAVTFKYALKELGFDFTAIPYSLIDSLLNQFLISHPTDTIATVPRYLRDTLIFPYKYGLEFVRQLYIKGGWKSINKAFNKVPESTEEIIHIDKYLKRDFIRIDPNIFPKKFSSFQKVYNDIFGEYNIYQYLLQYTNNEYISSKGAEGWRGDLIVLYYMNKDPNTRILFHLIRWDTKKDKDEYINIMYNSIFKTHDKLNCYLNLQCRIIILPDDKNFRAILEINNTTTLYIVKAPINYYSEIEKLISQVISRL